MPLGDDQRYRDAIRKRAPLTQNFANVSSDTTMIAGQIPSVDADRKHQQELRGAHQKFPTVRFFRRPTPPPLPWNTEMLVLGEKDGAFAAVRNSRVLIYWPHGFGDFVHLSYVIPLLEPSNEYFITRFGDDFVHLYDEGRRAAPIYSGEMSVGNGSAFGVAPHFGLDMDAIANRVERIEIPEPLRSRIHDAKVELMLFSRYPEMTGRTPYPYQTKARFLASKLVGAKRLAQFDLSKPLRSSLAFRAPADAVRRVEQRLRDAVAPGERLYLLSPGGHTQLRKVFPEKRLSRSRARSAGVILAPA